MTALAAPQGSIVRNTFLALLAPRRLIPILLVCIPLVMLQWRMSREPLAAPLGIAMCAAFVLIGPLSFRVLFPEGLDFTHGAVRIVLYGAIGAGVVLVVGKVVPDLLEMAPTLLTVRSSLIVCCTLFLVGGWGLGRDIFFEASLHLERRRGDVLAREAEHAQLLALRSHLDPHFLFNTLSAIAEWCREDGEVAERAVLQLSSILRAVLAGVKSPTWPLASELELVRTLFDLHLLRDPDRFSVTWDLDDALVANVSLPPMLLMPIAENAVKHGPAKGHRGAVAVRVARERGRVLVVIENAGGYEGPREGSDGLPTVTRRLALAYADEASLAIAPVDGNARTRVTLSLPESGPRPGVKV